MDDVTKFSNVSILSLLRTCSTAANEELAVVRKGEVRIDKD